MARDIIFVSHANPEDNDFARWLALRLAAEGYGVWCDVTQLLGGEAFWSDIEAAIRTRTVKFLYVLSRTSNHKPGPLKELQVASNVGRDEALQDCIIPLFIDDLPPRQSNILLADINAISFRASWARGFAQLLEKLEKDGVPRHPSFGAGAVASWWRTHYATELGTRIEPEQYISNWFQITELPATVYVHQLRPRMRAATVPLAAAAGSAAGSLFPQLHVAAAVEEPEPFAFPELWTLPFPCARAADRLVSFAPAEDLFTGAEPFVVDSVEMQRADFVAAGFPPGDILPVQGRNNVLELLGVAWERMARGRGLRRYKMATKRGAMFFPAAITKKSGNIDYVNLAKKLTYRRVVGVKKQPKRYWHFAVDARPLLEPEPHYVIKPHVAFSDDGATIWDNTAALHRARRSQCKTWWNEQWRDRILATVQFLARGQNAIAVPVARSAAVTVASTPVRFESPVAFSDPNTDPFLDGESSDDSDDA